MFHPEGCGLLHQATLDAICKYPDHQFYLPVGFTVANSDVVVHNAQPFAELCEAACKFGTIVYPDVAWLGPTGKQVFIQELSSPPAV